MLSSLSGVRVANQGENLLTALSAGITGTLVITQWKNENGCRFKVAKMQRSRDGQEKKLLE
jgi:hypothetical protein